MDNEKLENAVNLGTNYPSESAYNEFVAKRQAIADEVNGGDIGEVIRYEKNGKGVECFFAPSINARWKNDFS